MLIPCSSHAVAVTDNRGNKCPSSFSFGPQAVPSSQLPRLATELRRFEDADAPLWRSCESRRGNKGPQRRCASPALTSRSGCSEGVGGDRLVVNALVYLAPPVLPHAHSRPCTDHSVGPATPVVALRSPSDTTFCKIGDAAARPASCRTPSTQRLTSSMAVCAFQLERTTCHAAVQLAHTLHLSATPHQYSHVMVHRMERALHG